MTARKATANQSWDEFWAEQSNKETTVIRGVKVAIPSDVPVGFKKRLDELQESEDDDDVAELIALLFGQDVFSEWEAAGIGSLEFKTILTWGMARAGGTQMTFAEALKLVREADEGKAPAPNRAARRAAPKPRSAVGGGPSKRTSSASTGSARRTSRA